MLLQDGEHRNTILLTQPMKRPLIQAGNQDRYWTVSKIPRMHPFAWDIWGIIFLEVWKMEGCTQ